MPVKYEGKVDIQTEIQNQEVQYLPSLSPRNFLEEEGEERHKSSGSLSVKRNTEVNT